MLSDVMLAGYLAERKGRIRYIECESKKDCYTEEIMISKIPTIYWTRDENNVLNTLKKGTLVMCRGRIECEKDVGFYVLIETLITPK